MDKEKKEKDDTYKYLGKELDEEKVKIKNLKEATEEEAITKIELEEDLVNAKEKIIEFVDQALKRAKAQRMCLHPNLHMDELYVFKVIMDKHLVD